MNQVAINSYFYGIVRSNCVKTGVVGLLLLIKVFTEK